MLLCCVCLIGYNSNNNFNFFFCWLKMMLLTLKMRFLVNVANYKLRKLLSSINEMMVKCVLYTFLDSLVHSNDVNNVDVLILTSYIHTKLK